MSRRISLGLVTPLVALLLAAFAVAALAGPALATEDEPAPAEEEEETVVTFAPGEEPAIELDLAEEAELPGPQWTYRFLVPLTITLAVLVVVVTVVMYFVRVVRARYQVQ